MLTRIDHVMVCVHDLNAATQKYEALGFNIYPGGIHPGRGTHNAIAFFENDYLELLAIRDPKEADPALIKFLEQGEGLRYFIIQSNDLEADVAAMRKRSVGVTEVREASRHTQEGTELRWRYANLGPRNAFPFFLIQHLTPIEERRAQVPSRTHPNGATGIAGVSLPGNPTAYEHVLGVPPAKLGIELRDGPVIVTFHGTDVTVP